MKLRLKLGNYSALTQFISFVLIRYLYIFLTVNILDGLYYVGHGTYDIAFNLQKEVLAMLVFIAVSFLYLRKHVEDDFAETVMHMLFVLYYIPINSAYSINDLPMEFFLASNIYFGLLVLLLKDTFAFDARKLRVRGNTDCRQDVPKKSFDLTVFDSTVVRSICFVMCYVYIVYKISYNGFSFSLSINSEDVYANRAAYQTILDAMSGTLFSYVLAVVRNVIAYVAPFYLFVSLKQRRLIPLMVSILCILSMYSVTSGKGTIFFVVILIFVYFCAEYDLLKYFSRIFDYGIIAILLICVLEMVALHSNRIYTIFIRREMYLPAWLNTMYFDFFSINPKVHWSQNVFLLQKFMHPVYSEAPLTIISNTYFNGEVPSPNTGLFAEAYMHFGFAGVVIYPIILCVLIKLSSRVYKDYGTGMVMLMAIKLALQLTNVPITRTDFVLSYGLFTLMAYLMPRICSGKVIKRNADSDRRTA